MAICTIEKANVAINRLVQEDRLGERAHFSPILGFTSQVLTGYERPPFSDAWQQDVCVPMVCTSCCSGHATKQCCYNREQQYFSHPGQLKKACAPSPTGELCCVVVDEMHMLSDPQRGPALELALTKILHSCHAPAIQVTLARQSSCQKHLILCSVTIYQKYKCMPPKCNANY